MFQFNFMALGSREKDSEESGNSRFFSDLGRAYGGAIVFSFPMMMTMENWWLGFTMDGSRLTLFTLLAIPLLVGLSYFDGFEDTFTLADDIRETFTTYAVGFSASALMLFLFGVIGPEMSWDEVIGKISIQAITASLGAMFAQSILGGEKDAEEHAEQRKRKASYGGQIFLTVVGAIFLSMSVSTTEEIMLISYQMTDWHAIGLVATTLLIMHGFTYAAENKLRGEGNQHKPWAPGLFFRYTVVGYASVLVISLYILWTFGSINGMGVEEMMKVALVLAFPAGLGGAASRLIL